MSQKFSETELCKGGTACDLCRGDNRIGKAFRAALLTGAKFEDVPDENFDCVRELRAGLTNLPKPPPDGLDVAEHRRSICAGCKYSYTEYCMRFGKCPSSRKNWASAIEKIKKPICPEKKWTY